MTAIEWCDVTWNPVVGCSRVSPGCDNCYAVAIASRNLCPQHRGLTKVRPKGAERPGRDWTGEVRTVPQLLEHPLRWRKPRRVFVNSMSDLFHHGVPLSFRAAVFAVMAACPQHTFIVVTKRPGLAAMPWDSFQDVWQRADEDAFSDIESLNRVFGEPPSSVPWPLPNVHVLVSAENQMTWDQRVPLLLEMPAAIRGVSAEPLLGPISAPKGLGALDWLVIGGESGPKARPCDVDWIRSLKGAAEQRGVPVFVKQLGSESKGAGEQRGKANDMESWPADLRVRDFPREAVVA